MGGCSMSGPCAKRRVQAVLIATDGTMYLGENLCYNPQPVCPRKPSEGYAKCKSICNQPCHAEMDALFQASGHRRGSRMIISHTHACEACAAAMKDCGVATIEFVGKE